MGLSSLIGIFGFLLQYCLQSYVVTGVIWEDWWTYEGISGPAFWGLINPEWSLCNRGRRQSPVNLEPAKLLFDPNLRSLHIDKHRISGNIANTGHSIVFTVDNTTRHHINVTGGPLSYKYQFQEMHLHYGLHDDSGSEHSINGYTFPAEIQIFGFNSQLYSNFSEALLRAQGIVAISLLLQLGDLSNPELRILTDQVEKIKYGGEEVEIKRLSLKGLLPDTEYYMTYDGSTTMPACHETVTWVILNKPIYITKQQLHGLRRLVQGDAKQPKAPLGNNFRPPQPLHHRPVRTNIDFNSNQVGDRFRGVSRGRSRREQRNIRQPGQRNPPSPNDFHSLFDLMTVEPALHHSSPPQSPEEPQHGRVNGGAKYCPSMYREVYYKANSWKQH